MWNECSCAVVWTFFAIAFLWIGIKTDIFQFCGHGWFFQVCWHIECNTFTASSFRIWNSSSGIPSSPLALFVVMLPKAHLSSHPRMSGSRWVTTASWLSISSRAFLYTSFVYSCLSLLFFFCLFYAVAIFVLFCAYLCMKCSLGISNFLKKRSLVFPILLFSSICTDYLGRLCFSLCYLLELNLQLSISFPFSSTFRFSSFLNDL